MLKKMQFKHFFIFLFFLVFVISSNTKTHANSKYASIIIEEHSEKILYSRSANQLRNPASMTKVMTLYLIFEDEAAQTDLEQPNCECLTQVVVLVVL